jgi:hypothetical protein
LLEEGRENKKWDMKSRKIIAGSALLSALIAIGFFIYFIEQVEEVPEVKIDPRIIEMTERYIVSRSKEQFDELKSAGIERLRTDITHVYPENLTRVPSGGNFTLRMNLMLTLYLLRVHEFINGSEPLAREIYDFMLDITNKNGGVLPSFATACAGPYFIWGMSESGMGPNDPIIRKALTILDDLRVADGGWVVLEFSKALKPDGTPYSVSSTEVNPTVVLAMLKAGRSIDHPVVKRAIKANDEAILASAYKEEYFPDYILGHAWSILMYKEIGIRNFDAYRKARNELIEYVLAEPDPNDTFLIANALLALQGVIPESSKPYRNGLSMMMSQYDINTSSFVAGESPVFGKEFVKSAHHSIYPLFVLKKLGYEGKLYDINISSDFTRKCGEIIKEGDILVVKSENQPYIEWTNDNFVTINLEKMREKESGKYEYRYPVKPFHIVLNCSTYYWVSGWYD